MCLLISHHSHFIYLCLLCSLATIACTITYEELYHQQKKKGKFSVVFIFCHLKNWSYAPSFIFCEKVSPDDWTDCHLLVCVPYLACEFANFVGSICWFAWAPYTKCKIINQTALFPNLCLISQRIDFFDNDVCLDGHSSHNIISAVMMAHFARLSVTITFRLINIIAIELWIQFDANGGVHYIGCHYLKHSHLLPVMVCFGSFSVPLWINTVDAGTTLPFTQLPTLSGASIVCCI